MSWARVLFGVVGLVTLAAETIIFVRVFRLKRETGEAWSDWERMAVASVRGPYLVFGAACVAVAAVGRPALSALWVAGVVLVAALPLRWWLARRPPTAD